MHAERAPLSSTGDRAAIFELDSVAHHFEDAPALADVSLSVYAGERVAVMGPSGAGKSTLLGLLNGSLSPTRGRVWVLGEQLSRLAPGARRRVQSRIGTVYQQYHLVDNLAVVHNLNAGRLGQWPLWKALLSLAWPQDLTAARQALDQVGIPEKLYARTDSLSGGQQQRVAIARVLVQNPQAILADEPVSNLDPERGREIMDLLRDVSAHSGRALVASLHAVEFVYSHFQRAIGLRHGRVLFDLPVSQLTAGRVEALYQL